MNCPIERGGCGAELQITEGAFCDKCIAKAKSIVEARKESDKIREIMSALKSLLTFSIGHFPVTYYSLKDVSKAELKEDAKAPFFSEAYLYDLMGKEEARTVLYYIRNLCRVAGISDTDQRMP